MKRKTLILGALLAAMSTLSGCSLFYPNPVPTPTSKPTQTATPTPTVDPTPTIDPNLKKVELNLIDSSAFLDNGTVDVIAEALAVVEDDGKCTLSVTQGTASQSVTVDAESNVNSTQCFPMNVPLAGFKAGKVSYTVTYVSAKHTGHLAGTIPIE